MIDHIEMHIAPTSDFTTKGWAKKVKAVGGTYSQARGYADRRFVTLPTTPEGLKLMGELHKAFHLQGRNTPWVAQPSRGPAWVAVQYVPQGAADPVGEFTRLWAKAMTSCQERFPNGVWA